MGHIHEYIDFAVSIYIVHNRSVLLVHHRELQKWLPVGGHIELNEEPEAAAYREIKEECGLEVELVGAKPTMRFQGHRFLCTPSFLDIHAINETHQHIGLTYFARAHHDTPTLNVREHSAMRWFTRDALTKRTFKVPGNIRFYGEEALRILRPKILGDIPRIVSESLTRSDWRRIERLAFTPKLQAVLEIIRKKDNHDVQVSELKLSLYGKSVIARINNILSRYNLPYSIRQSPASRGCRWLDSMVHIYKIDK